MTLGTPSPQTLGLPPKFTGWHSYQSDAIHEIRHMTLPYLGLCAPTAHGKSLDYIAAALWSGWRTCILTMTKGLQEQLMDDFASCGLVDIKGQNNYECIYVTPPPPDDPIMVDKGPCHAGVRCEFKTQGCHYYDRVNLVLGSRLVVANYSYWMHKTFYGGGLGHFDLLVCDEAHDALDALSDFVKVEISTRDLKLIGIKFMPDFPSFSDWRNQCVLWMRMTSRKLTQLENSIRGLPPGHADEDTLDDIRLLKNFNRRLHRLTTSETGWVYQKKFVGKWALEIAQFNPVWPADYSHVLFNTVPKVVLTSATLTEKDLDLLGIKPEERKFVEYPSTIPVPRRRVYHVRSVKVHHKMSPESKNVWRSKIDAIIEPRLALSWKGIIQTVSYDRAQWLARHSRWSAYFLLNEDSKATSETVELFKSMPGPVVLVSPSVSTGWDFIDDYCRYQILCKCPFATTTDLVLQARQERDKDYVFHVAAKKLIQEAGRSTRTEEDWSEVFIVDDNFIWLYHHHRKFFSSSFQQAVLFRDIVPEPLVLA